MLYIVALNTIHISLNYFVVVYVCVWGGVYMLHVCVCVRACVCVCERVCVCARVYV